jgi:hypothetical protein
MVLNLIPNDMTKSTIMSPGVVSQPPLIKQRSSTDNILIGEEEVVKSIHFTKLPTSTVSQEVEGIKN